MMYIGSAYGYFHIPLFISTCSNTKMREKSVYFASKQGVLWLRRGSGVISKLKTKSGNVERDVAHW